MSKVYIEEFLYRGRCPHNEAGQPNAFHVVLAQWATGPDGAPTLQRAGPLTLEQAAEVGFSLNDILGEITVSAIRERDDLSTKLTALEAKLAERNAVVASIAEHTKGLQSKKSLLTTLTLGLVK